MRTAVVSDIHANIHALEDSWTKYKTTMSIRDLPETPGP